MTSSETDVRTRDASELGQRTGLRRRPVVATALTVASFDVLCAMELLRARVFDGFVFSSVEVLALMLRPLLLLAVGSQLLFGMVVLRGGPRLGRMACWVAVATVVGTGTALLASALHNPHDGVLASARNLWLLGVVLGVWLVALVAGWRYLRQPLRVPAPVVWGLLAIYVLLDFWLIDGFVWRETFVFGSFATLVASANLLALGLTVSVLTAWVVRSVSPSRGLHAACLAWLGAHVTVAIGGQLVSGNQATQHAWRTHAPLTVAAARIEPNRVMRAQRPAACRDDRQGPARECGTPPEVPREPRNNLLLVTIDALRADRVTHRLMPNLTEFSEQAVIWENAYTPEISTYRTLYTYLHNTVPCHWSLPRVLGELGYQTFAISAISRPALLAHFDIAVSLENERGHQAVRLVTTGDDTVARFEQLLDSSSDKPFFAWVHFFDVHGIYVRNPHFDYGDSPEERYDAEASFTDRALGRLLGMLRARRLLGSTNVAVIADHGEEHFEHGKSAHLPTHYAEVTRIPAMIRVPGRRPERRAAPFSGRGLPRLLLASLGGPDAAGRAMAALEGDPIHIACGNARSSIQSGGWKLIVDDGIETLELYDLVADPRERNNAYDRERRRGLELWDDLCRWHRTCSDVRPAIRAH